MGQMELVLLVVAAALLPITHAQLQTVWVGGTSSVNTVRVRPCADLPRCVAPPRCVRHTRLGRAWVCFPTRPTRECGSGCFVLLCLAASAACHAQSLCVCVSMIVCVCVFACLCVSVSAGV